MTAPAGRPARFRLPEPEDPGGLGLPRPNRKIVLVLGGILAALVVVRLVVTNSQGATTAIVPTSCASPAVGVEAPTVTHGGSITFEVTGPEVWTYVGWIDAATSRSPAGGQPSATPSRAGLDPELVLPPLTLTGCRLTVTQPLADDVAVGPHSLVIFRDESGVDVQVASVPFAVVQPSGR